MIVDGPDDVKVQTVIVDGKPGPKCGHFRQIVLLLCSPLRRRWFKMV